VLDRIGWKPEGDVSRAAAPVTILKRGRDYCIWRSATRPPRCHVGRNIADWATFGAAGGEKHFRE